MQFFSKLFGEEKEKGIDATGVLGAQESVQIMLNGGSVGLSKKAAMQLFTGYSYACIRAIGEEMQSMEYRLYEIDSNGDRKRIYEHEILDILENGVDGMTGVELRFNTSAHLEAVGNAYWYIGTTREKEKPQSIELLDPSKVTVETVQEGMRTYIRGYKYGQQSFTPNEVLHFRSPNMANSTEGKGTVQAIGDWIQADELAVDFNKNFFKNGARVSGFLETQDITTDEQIQALKQSFAGVYEGLNNAHKTVVLPTGYKYTEGGKTQKDLDFANLMVAMRDRILSGFRVPKTALGISDDVNRANAEATNYVFALRTIKPKMVQHTAVLQKYLIPRYRTNKRLEITFKDPVQENEIEKANILRIALGGQPYMSINEARAAEGLPPIANGDAVQSIGTPTPVGEPEEKGAVKTHEKNHLPREKKEIENEKKDAFAKAVSDSIQKHAHTHKEVPEATFMGKNADEWEAKQYKDFRDTYEKYETPFKNAVQDFNAAQKKEVLRNLAEQAKAVKVYNADQLFDLEKDKNMLVKLVLPFAVGLAEEEAQVALDIIESSDPIPAIVRDSVETGLELMSETYQSTTRNLLKSAIENAVVDGLPHEELVRKIQEIYEFSDEKRAELVAKTETVRVANEATRNTWDTVDGVKGYQWYTASWDRVCEFCRPMHGKKIGKTENFFQKGEVYQGDEGGTQKINYSNIKAPPLHPNCQCQIVPVIVE